MQPMDWTIEHRPEQIEDFQYPAVEDSAPAASWNGWGAEADDDVAEEASQPATSAVEASVRAEYERRLGEETRRSFEAGRERGRQEGRQEERDSQKPPTAPPMPSAQSRPPHWWSVSPWSATAICRPWSTRSSSWRWPSPREFCAAKRRWIRCC